MKTLNMNSKIAGLFGMMMLALSGCGSSGNNAAPVVGGINGSGYCSPGYANCATTGVYGAGGANGVIARAAGIDGGQSMMLALNFVGQSGTTTYGYQGPYAAYGYFILTNYISQSCPMQPGTYQIQSISQGYSWNSGTNLNLTMIAQGPSGQVQMTLSNGFILGRQGGSITGPDGQPYENSVAGSLTIAQCPYYPSITIGI